MRLFRMIYATNQISASHHTNLHQSPREIKNTYGLGSTTTNILWPQSDIASTIKFATLLRHSDFPWRMGRSLEPPPLSLTSQQTNLATSYPNSVLSYSLMMEV